MKNKFLIYAFAAVAVLSLSNVESKAASLSLGSSAGIASALETYEANTINAEVKIKEYQNLRLKEASGEQGKASVIRAEKIWHLSAEE